MVRDINFRGLDLKKHAKHIRYIDKHIRPADLLEINAFGLKGFNDAMERMAATESMDTTFIALSERNIPLCVFGLSCMTGEHGRAIWCIGSTELDKYSREFLRYSAMIIGEWLKTHDSLFNYVSIKNKKAIRWLKSLGAQLGAPFLIGKEEFQVFVIKRGDNNVS